MAKFFTSRVHNKLGYFMKDLRKWKKESYKNQNQGLTLPFSFQAPLEKKPDFEELVKGYMAFNEQRLKENDLYRKEQESFNRDQRVFNKNMEAFLKNLENQMG